MYFKVCSRMAVLQNFGHFLNFPGGKVKNRNTRLASPQVKVYFLRNRIFKMSASAKCRGGRGLIIVKKLRTSHHGCDKRHCEQEPCARCVCLHKDISVFI